MRLRSRNAAFTLLELVVVLAILATVTALAVRALDGVEDQRRFEAAMRGLEELSIAITGSPDNRVLDDASGPSGFISDMGRLPRTAGTTEFDLRELWLSPGTPYDIRPAIVANGVPIAAEDLQVLVPGGWRGPYLRLPLGATTLLDAWGNGIVSPANPSPPNPNTTGYARLRDASDAPITAAAQEVRIIRILGANGRADASDTGYDRDHALHISDDKVRAALAGSVEVRDGDSPATPVPAEFVSVRVFQPSPADPAQISVLSATVPFTMNPVSWNIPAASGVTIGLRVVRAYRLMADGSTRSRVSGVKHIQLQGGNNLLNLTIDRAP